VQEQREEDVEEEVEEDKGEEEEASVLGVEKGDESG
jgi:hypothetical protein